MRLSASKYSVLSCFFVSLLSPGVVCAGEGEGEGPEAKTVKVLHGALLMRNNVSSLWQFHGWQLFSRYTEICTTLTQKSVPRLHRNLYHAYTEICTTLILTLHVLYHAVPHELHNDNSTIEYHLKYFV